MMPSIATRPRTLKILRGEPPRMAANGATTQRFFAEGDLHEGTQWKYAGLPPDDAIETKSDTDFESFDKIPRRRSKVLAILAIGAFLLVGSAAWTMMFRSTVAGVVLRSWVSSTLGVRTPPVQAEHKEPALPVEAPAVARPSALPEPRQTQPIVAKMETEQRQPSTQLEHSELNDEDRAPAVAESPLAASSVEAASAPPPPQPPQRVGRQPATSAHPSAGAHPLRGFVWSPATGGLVQAVPADPVQAVPADPVQADPAGSADPAVPAPDPSP
jgi:hypothetical protein